MMNIFRRGLNRLRRRSSAPVNVDVVPIPRDDELLRAAVAMLDVATPQWRKLVNVDELDMMDNEWCVLGQVYGSYRQGIQRLYDDDDDYSPIHSAFRGTFPRDLWVEELGGKPIGKVDDRALPWPL